jgi:hypothetical protein
MFNLLEEYRIDERKITVHDLITKYSLHRTNFPNSIYFSSDIIESVLFKIPTNKIWIYTLIDNQYYVLSGNYIFDIDAFMNDLYPLENLKLFAEYNGFRFSDMKRNLQRRIEETYLDVVIVHIYKSSNIPIIIKKINSVCFTL